jgi:hypothetical protein
MQLPLTGGCACGAVRYRCDAEPIAMFKCHCRDCQRATGTGAACVLYVPRAAFALTQGTLAHHHTPSLDGTQNKRGFCASCGSPLTGAEEDKGIGIHAGSLDDPSVFRPQMHIHVSDAQPWDALDPTLPKHALYPD